MKIALSTESSSDLPKNLRDEYDVHVIPFTVVKGETMVKDGEEPLENLYAFVQEKKILPRTTAVNVEEFKEHFSNLLKEYDAIIHVSMSHACSSAYENAVAAAKEFEGKVFVVDSLVFHTGQALLVLYAASLINEGLSPEEIVESLKERANHISTTATLETVNYLYKGGRCNALAMIGANILGLRPMVELREGSIKLAKKFIGPRRLWTNAYINFVLNRIEKNGADKTVAFVSSTTDMPEATEIAVNKLKAAGFENVFVAKAGATIGTHTGPGTFSIEYFADGPHSWSIL
ncbi:MAG: DegV family protein [Bacilli bacterium]|nr:DegV family protein [Bacilli bacterium]